MIAPEQTCKTCGSTPVDICRTCGEEYGESGEGPGGEWNYRCVHCGAAGCWETRCPECDKPMEDEE